MINGTKNQTLLNVFDENKIQMHTESENSVTFYRDEHKAKYFLCKVNRPNLLEKSDFYRTMTKNCFKDHEDDFFEVTIPAKYLITFYLTFSKLLF